MILKLLQKNQTKDNRTFTSSKLKFRHFEEEEKDNRNLMRLHHNTHQEIILVNLHVNQQETKVQLPEDPDHHHQI
jgi:1,4-alpha-glucan branching enzyme